MYDTSRWLGGKEFKSRLIVGTGKYPSFENMREAIEASGAEIVTVAVRRVNLPGQGESLLDYVDPKRYTLLPNTAGCYTAAAAVRTGYLAREAGLGTLVKLEVIGDSRTLFPDVLGLLEATRTLAREGFTVLPYSNDDPVMAKKLEDAGAAAVMPLGAPIGSGLGIRNPYNIKLILEAVTVPVIVDAGVGTASDAAIALAAPLCEATRHHRARLLINDRADVALAVGADGVQRTHASLPVAALRGITPPGFLIGASAHSTAEAREAAAQGADFVVFGPVYDTPSKRRYGSPQGLAALEAAATASTRPVLAVGGITPERVPEVCAAGAAGVAVIGAIYGAARPADATKAFLDVLGSA